LQVEKEKDLNRGKSVTFLPTTKCINHRRTPTSVLDPV